MSTRRQFLAATTVASLAAMVRSTEAAPAAADKQDHFLLRQYLVETEEQRKRTDAYLRDAALPAWNRVGLKPVGVFYPQEGLGPIYVLLRHESLDVLANIDASLWTTDAEYRRAGADFLDATTPDAAFKRMESSLLLAFKGMPRLESPAKGPNRVFQLRIYESPSTRTNLKKIEMFNDAGEIAIFRRVGLQPVFFGQALVGGKLPNLTYMLGFSDAEAMKAAWQKFRSDPGWLKLRTMDEYADKTILCGITNLVLRPAEYSQL